MKHLHVGLTAPQLYQAFRTITPVLPATSRIIIDGDGWRSWGDPLGTAGNDKHTLHVIFTVENRQQAEQIITAGYSFFRTPILKDNHVVLTDIDNWTTLDNDERLVQTWVLSDWPHVKQG